MATTSRIPLQGTPNQDKTARVLTDALQTPVFASTLALVFIEYYTLVQVGTLTGAMTINFGVGSATLPPYVGDKVELIFINSSGSTQTVTLGTGVVATAATIALPTGKTASFKAIFNGTTWSEVGRAITV